MNKLTKCAASAVLAAALAIPGAVSAAEDGKDRVLSNLPLYELGTLSGTGDLGITDSANAEATFRQPVSVAVKADGRLLVSDAGNQRIRVIASGQTHSTAGIEIGVDDYGFLIGSMLNGQADEAAFQIPSGLSIGRDGRTYIADADNHAVRAMAQDGRVTTVAGDGTFGLADGAGSDARFNHPLDVAVNEHGVIFVADTLNHVIRKIENGTVTTLTAPSDRIVEYFPGAVEAAGDYADGPLAQAKFNEPSGLVLDAKGNLYVSDTGNNRIRYIDFDTGMVTTVAGASAVSYERDDVYALGDYKDGPASEAVFNAPKGIAVTPDGGLLIADSLNHVIRYLKDGTVITVAGVPGESSKSDGLAAFGGLNNPSDVAWLADGSFVIADTGNNRVRIVKPYERPAGLIADGLTKIVMGQELIESDANPIIRNGTTFVPIRVISEKLAYKVDFSDGGQTVLRSGDESYTVTAGSRAVTYTAGGVSSAVQLPETPFIMKDRLYLPVRFFAEQINLDVKWLSDVKTVLLRQKTAM